MSKRFQNLNKYRNAFPAVNIPKGASSSDASSLIQVNHRWIAVKWSGHGGSIGLLPLDKPGKACSNNARVFHAHGASLSDWCFSEFDDSLLATGAEDGLIKVWKINENEDPSCQMSAKTPSRRVDMIKFHSTTDQIVTTLGNDGKKVCIWDIEKSTSAIEISAETPMHSFSWKADGSLMTTSGKSVINVWDPRTAKEPTLSGLGHEGIKGSKATWLGDSNCIFSVGTDKMRSRQYALWDSRNLSQALVMNQLDFSTGILLPLFDEDTETVYILSRGDSNIRSLQISDLHTKPSIELVTTHGPNEVLYGAALLPKHSLNVMQAEIARVMAISADSVIPISYRVPKKSYLDFDPSLFPHTKGTVPSLTGSEWFEGKTAAVAKVSLDPATLAREKVQKPQEAVEKTAKETAELSINSENQSSEKKTEDRIAETTTDENKTPKNEALEDNASSDKPFAAVKESVASANKHLEAPLPKEKGDIEEKPKPSGPSTSTTKVAPKYGSTGLSAYKYLSAKVYHPSTHFDDLRGLSINKSGDCDLIQANAKFIAVPISGPGGRVGIINAQKPGRLPTHIPCVVCGSEVTNFKFDPFDHNRLITISQDNRIRVWDIPEDGIEQDLLEPKFMLTDGSMDKLHLLEFHPTSKDVLLTVSQDFNNHTIRIWDLKEQSVKLKFDGINKNMVFTCAWNVDGSQIATTSKEKVIRIIDARTGNVLSEGRSHDSLRPSRIVWLDKTNELIASVGFGLGSSRELLLYRTSDMSKPIASQMIDISPSVMSVHYDLDCRIVYVAGRGDRTIHCYEIEDDKFVSLPKIEATSLQQGFAFLPKSVCNVKEIEIGKFYRLTPTTIEVMGVRVPRARPEYFQDDIFIPTLDVEHYAQEASDWFNGTNNELNTISLKPEDMELLSTAPPPASQVRAKVKFEMGKKIVSEDERRQQLMDRMFHTAKEVENEAPPVEKEEDPEVADEEWDA
ncbi:Putative Coronin [Rhizopus microsporus]|nr:Putative Coronin [Rhizopus microsporus]